MISGNFTVQYPIICLNFLLYQGGNYHPPQKSIIFSNEMLNILIKKTL